MRLWNYIICLAQAFVVAYYWNTPHFVLAVSCFALLLAEGIAASISKAIKEAAE